MNDRQRLEAIVAVVCRYLPPDGITRKEAMSQIIRLVDPLPEKEWVSLTDEEIRLMCHNDEPEDWNDLRERQYWRVAYTHGAKAAQDELRSKNA